MAAARRSTVPLVVDSAFGFAPGVVVAFLVYQAKVGAGALADRAPITNLGGTSFSSAGPDLARGGGVALTLLVGLALASIYRGGCATTPSGWPSSG